MQPLLVIFEDLHWIDSETQTFLDSLVESLPTARLLLLVNYRPEYRHGWGSKTYYTQLRLDALPPESASELLLALLGTDATVEPLKPVLIARTGGNPLFLEESVWALVETNALTGTRGAHRLARPLDTIDIPATVAPRRWSIATSVGVGPPSFARRTSARYSAAEAAACSVLHPRTGAMRRATFCGTSTGRARGLTPLDLAAFISIFAGERETAWSLRLKPVM